MADQILQLGEAAAERTLSLAGRTFIRIPIEQSAEVKTADYGTSAYFDPTIKVKNIFRITFFQLTGIDTDTPDNQTGRDNILVERNKFIPLNLIVTQEDGSTITYQVKFSNGLQGFNETWNRVLGDQGQKIFRYNIIMELKEV